MAFCVRVRVIVWLSYCFHSQLCEPFNEVLFDPVFRVRARLREAGPTSYLEEHLSYVPLPEPQWEKLKFQVMAYVNMEPHSIKSLSSLSPDSRLSVISITMATTSADTDGTRKHRNIQDVIDTFGLPTGFLESNGK